MDILYSNSSSLTSAAVDVAVPRLTSRSLSQAFGLATVRVYHRRAAELNRWVLRAILFVLSVSAYIDSDYSF